MENYQIEDFLLGLIDLTIIKDLRDEIPLIGTRKLLFQLGPHLEEHGIKMGRDQLIIPGNVYNDSGAYCAIHYLHLCKR